MTINPANRLAATASALACLASAAAADEVRTYTGKAAFEDVKFELGNAIIARGLTIDYTGQIGRMLERTGADVGSTKPLYAQAEFVTFCSAKLSRATMEADPANIAFCPYVIFIYQAADKPGETVVGYRRPQSSGSDASRKALGEIDALLDGIARQAVK
jgi:hypothetical protein